MAAGPGIWHLALDTWYLVLGTWYWAHQQWPEISGQVVIVIWVPQHYQFLVPA